MSTLSKLRICRILREGRAIFLGFLSMTFIFILAECALFSTPTRRYLLLGGNTNQSALGTVIVLIPASRVLC